MCSGLWDTKAEFPSECSLQLATLASLAMLVVACSIVGTAAAARRRRRRHLIRSGRAGGPGRRLRTNVYEDDEADVGAVLDDGEAARVPTVLLGTGGNGSAGPGEQLLVRGVVSVDSLFAAVHLEPGGGGIVDTRH